MTNPSNLKELIEQGYASPARLPEKNDFLFNSGSLDLSRLDSLKGYTVPLIDHDYGAKTALMWNSLYEKLSLNIRNIMIVADPKNAPIIFAALKSDPKYLGGGLGSGFKEIGLKYLDRSVPEDLRAANIAVKEGNSLVGYNTDTRGFVQSLEDKLAVLGKEINGSSFIVVGAGGVAKETVKMLAEKGASYIAIANRTFSKAVELANWLNQTHHKDLAVGIPEVYLRGALLNSEIKADAIMNLTNKGSDNVSDATMFYPTSDEDGNKLSAGTIEHVSRDTIRYAIEAVPNLIYADIALVTSGKTKSLRLVEAELVKVLTQHGRYPEEAQKALRYILNGIPMVVNQAGPAYILVQEANPDVHTTKVTEKDALTVFKEVTNYRV